MICVDLRAVSAWMLGLALLAACTGTAWAASPWPEAWRPVDLQRALVQLDSLMQVGDYETVIGGTTDLLRSHADDPRFGPQLSVRLGVALLRTDRPAEAIAPLEDAVRAAPHEADYHRNLATALIRLGRRGRALSEYREAVALAPNDAQIRREYGQALTKLRSWQEAEKQLMIAARLCSDCRASVTALADLYLASGQDARAADRLSSLLREGPDPRLRSELIGALQRSGRDADLVAVLTKSPVLDLTAVELNLLADADLRLARLGRARAWSAALPDLSALPVGVHDDARFWATVALNLLQNGEPGLALTAVQRAVDLDPDNRVYLNNQVVALQDLGRREEAKRLWERLQRLEKKQGERKE